MPPFVVHYVRTVSGLRVYRRIESQEIIELPRRPRNARERVKLAMQLEQRDRIGPRMETRYHITRIVAVR